MTQQKHGLWKLEMVTNANAIFLGKKYQLPVKAVTNDKVHVLD